MLPSPCPTRGKHHRIGLLRVSNRPSLWNLADTIAIAHLNPLSPPSPADDPREPTPTAARPTRGSRTPNRHISPVSSRATSPIPGLPSHRLHSQPSLPHLPPSPSNIASFNAALAASGTHLSRPSSPNSIHSSSSAIFERDIEALPIPSLSLSHKPSRLSHPSHGSALDHTVPAVLDDAVEALTSTSNEPFQLDDVEIEAPAASATPAVGRQTSAGRPPPGSLNQSPSSGSPTHDAFGAVSPPITSQLGGSSTTGTQSPTDLLPARPKMAPRISTGPMLPGGFPLHGAGELATPDGNEQIEEVSHLHRQC